MSLSLRRGLAVLVATSLVALGAVAPASCKPRDCTLLPCDSAHARITVHVPVPPAQLAASKTTVCWREVCSDLVGAGDARASDAGAAIAFDTRTSLLMGQAEVSAEGAGASRLEITLHYFTRGTRGDFVHMRPADGDRYRVTVTDAAGVKLFDAERVVTYAQSYPNGPDCDPDPCRQATFDLPAP